MRHASVLVLSCLTVLPSDVASEQQEANLDRHANLAIHECMNGCMNGWMNGWLDG